jgi:hypothetical protein
MLGTFSEILGREASTALCGTVTESFQRFPVIGGQKARQSVEFAGIQV